METKEYHRLDKSAWGDGPWLAEPDKRQWQDGATGLPCLAVRSDATGAWCGYVGVGKDHPMYQAAARDLDWLDVHGGLNFSGACMHTPEEEGVCHVPAAGESDDVWWLGFDCAHLNDLMPAIEAMPRDLQHVPTWSAWPRHYRTLADVEAECAGLAAQLIQAAA